MAGALLVNGGGNKARASGAGAPGLIVAARGLARTGAERRAVRPDRRGRAGRVRHMRQLPGVRLIVLLRSAAYRPCDGASRSSPAGSSRLRRRRYRSPSAARSRAPDRSPGRAVVGVAELIVADELAMTPRVEERVEVRAVPPREPVQEKLFHPLEQPLAKAGPAKRRPSARGTMARRMRPVQLNFFALAPKSGLRARPDSSDAVKPRRR